jgi:hypothetical protein
MLNQPDLVAHADWGSTAQKRALAIARRTGAQGYRVGSTRRVHEPRRLLGELRDEAGPSGCLVVGFDFPIGLPLQYARRAGVHDFPSFLNKLGRGDWLNFYQVAATPEEINLHRPFYPRRAGASRLSHLLAALGASNMDDLRRQCERASLDPAGVTHRAACPLFWTMGGQQAGKAAILGWREVLGPALCEPSFRTGLWPFDGNLDQLIQTRRMVIAETYPAEFYHHLGVRFSSHKAGTKSGKRVRSERAANAGVLLDWAGNHQIEIEPALRAELADGFGDSPDGDDRFDAVVGVLGMLNVLLGNQPCEAPPDDQVRRIEGWILGKQATIRTNDFQREELNLKGAKK